VTIWIYDYGPEAKQQSSLWKSPNLPKPKKDETDEEQSQEHVNQFLDMKGTVHK
jgi:hypothetical protein